MNVRVWIAAPLLLAAVSGTRASGQAPATAPDAKGPTGAIGAFVLAFNSHDAVALGKLWTENAVHVSDDTGERLEGRQKISAAYAKLFADDPKSVLSLQLGAPRLLAPTVASLDGVATLRNSKGVETRSAVSLVLVQQNNQWLVAQAHESDLPSLPESAPKLAALNWLAGEWTGQGEDNQQVLLQLHWAPNLGFMMGRLAHSQGDAFAHEVFNVIGWDAEHQSLRSWQFASDGAFAEGVWQAEDPNKWLNKLVAKFPDGRRGALTHVLTRTSPDVLTLQTIDRDIDGEPQPNSSPITLTRTGSKPAASPAPAAAPPAKTQPPSKS